MSKGGKTTQTNTIGTGDQHYVGDVRNIAQHQAGVAGGLTADPNVGAAAGGFAGYGAAGNQGLAALSGDPAAMSKFMNPYTQDVINQMNGNWSNLAQQTTNSVDSNATASGAFGGSRSGVAEGTALAGLGSAQAAQMAQLRQQGFTNAQGVAGQVANLGLAGFQGQGQQGQYLSNYGLNQAALPAQIAEGGYMGPTSGTTTTQQSSNPWNALIGAGATLGSAAL